MPIGADVVAVDVACYMSACKITFSPAEFRESEVTGPFLFLFVCVTQEHHSENVVGLTTSASNSLDESTELALRNLGLGASSNPDNVEPILRKRQYVLQVGEHYSSFLSVFVFQA